MNEIPFEATSSVKALDQEKKALVSLQKLALAGSLENFEKVRAEEAAHFLSTNTRPTPGSSLYFFPETLPARSFEKEFALGELKPGIDELRQAHKQQRVKEAELAFTRLKTRVENYELGITSNPNDLSEDAKKFLKLYHQFTDINRVRLNR